MNKAETRLSQSVVGLAVCILLDALLLILAMMLKNESLFSVAWVLVAAIF